MKLDVLVRFCNNIWYYWVTGAPTGNRPTPRWPHQGYEAGAAPGNNTTKFVGILLTV